MADSDLVSSQRDKIRRDERTLSSRELVAGQSAEILGFEDLLPYLVSPDSRAPLQWTAGSQELSDGHGNSYPFRGELPLLIPSRLSSYYTNHLAIPPDAVTDSFMQYFFLSAIKQSGDVGEINAASDDVHYQRHLFRMKDFLRSARGIVLDLGCDDPMLGAALLDQTANYVGLDPFCRRLAPFRVIGFGEHLPFCDESFDAVVFNTSLDHILDWRRALDEAFRVLVPGGMLYVSTLVWTDRADLVTDAVHFHHFRDYEIFGALQAWELMDERRYDYKGASHRHGLYVSARKPAVKAN